MLPATPFVAPTLTSAESVAARTRPVGQRSGEMHDCTHDEINSGKKMTAVEFLHDSFVMTHATRRRIPKDVDFSHSVTMESQNVVEASIKATASVKADAGAFFALR